MSNKPNRALRVIAFLEARYPGWVPAIELEPVGGRQGWRTAVSEARQLLRERDFRFGEDDNPIENRVRVKHLASSNWTLSEYRLTKRGESSRTEDANNSLAPANDLPISDGEKIREVRNETAPHNVNEWSLR